MSGSNAELLLVVEYITLQYPMSELHQCQQPVPTLDQYQLQQREPSWLPNLTPGPHCFEETALTTQPICHQNHKEWQLKT